MILKANAVILLIFFVIISNRQLFCVSLHWLSPRRHKTYLWLWCASDWHLIFAPKALGLSRYRREYTL